MAWEQERPQFKGVQRFNISSGLHLLIGGALLAFALVLAMTLGQGDFASAGWAIGGVLGVAGIGLFFHGVTGKALVVDFDGLEVPTDFGMRFIPYDHISSTKPLRVETLDHNNMPTRRTTGVLILLRSGEEVRLVTGNEGAIIQAVNEAQRLYENAVADLETVKVDPKTLARRGRSGAKWMRELRSMMRVKRGYRDGPASIVDAQSLWVVVESPLVPDDERAGAAVALVPLERRAERERMARASKNAGDGLRALLTLASTQTPSDAELAAALGHVDSSR